MLQDSICEPNHSFWNSKKNATLQDLARHATFLTILQSGLSSVVEGMHDRDKLVNCDNNNKAKRLWRCNLTPMHLRHLKCDEHCTCDGCARNQKLGRPRLRKPVLRFCKHHDCCRKCRVLWPMLTLHICLPTVQ